MPPSSTTTFTQFVPHPVYEVSRQPDEPMAAWIVPKEDVKQHDVKFGYVAQVSREPGWAMVNSLGLDRESTIYLLANALALDVSGKRA